MTAIIYFGEMLVASLLAIVLLAISQLGMSSDAVLFAGGGVAWTLAEYLVHRFVLHGFRTDRTSATSCQSRRRGPHNFLANMDLFRAGLFDRRRRFRCRRASRLCLVFVRASLRASRSRQSAAVTSQASSKPSQICVPKLRRQHHTLGPCLRDDAAMMTSGQSHRFSHSDGNIVASRAGRK